MAARSEDLELVARVVAGDQAALSSLLQQIRAVVRSCLARARVRERALEGHDDDLLQGLEVLLVADGFRVLRNYRGEASLTTFAYAVAGRYFHRQARKLARAATEELSLASGIADPQAPQDEVLLLAAERARLRAALDKLPPEDRALLLLLVDEGMAAPAVAATLGISPGGVRMRKMRALKKLEELLEEEGPVKE